MLKRLDILGRFTCAVACLLCAVLPAKASPSVINAADFVSMVDARLYSPATHGLRSVRVIMRDTNAERISPELTHLRMALYWKAPDRRRARFETLDGRPTGPQSFDFLLTDGIDTLAFVVPQPFALRTVEMLPRWSTRLGTAKRCSDG